MKHDQKNSRPISGVKWNRNQDPEISKQQDHFYILSHSPVRTLNSEWILNYVQQELQTERQKDVSL